MVQDLHSKKAGSEAEPAGALVWEIAIGNTKEQDGMFPIFLPKA